MAETTLWRDVGRLRADDPREVAGFEVVGRLGAGGMGVVYLAVHPQMGTAALKLVREGATADESFRERFRREVAVARRVRSPRVARVLGADADAEPPWLATAFIDGPTLQEAVAADGPMSGDRLVALAVALADALAAIHRAKVVHRDLKPSNILLTADTPVVIDFGIASLREAPALTRTGIAVGTPGWMAPEQVRARRTGPRADVFTWGLVVAFAASGKLPFGRGAADAVFYRIVHEAPKLPDLPPPLDRLVREALTKDPRQRPGVAQVLAGLTEPSALAAAPSGTTVVGATLADRTAVVPTIVALGWGVDALPARPGGVPRSVDVGPAAASPGPVAAPGDSTPAVGGPGRVDAPAAAPMHPVPAPDAATPAALAPDVPVPPADVTSVPDATLRVHEAPSVAPGAGFWFLGAEHRTAASLAAAFQAGWDDAVEEVFRRRDPVWLGELATFLRALGLDEAGRIVAAGAADAPVAASMARLVLAIDPRPEPRVGPWRLTPEGLAAAAQGVLDGRTPGDRLVEIGAARVLRLWRGVPGMERAAAIDEYWRTAIDRFDRLVVSVSAQAGHPSPEERQRAVATLLQCAVHPDHERRLANSLAAAKRTLARRQAWWARLADEGEQQPAAAVLAVMTADRSRTLAQGERAVAKAHARQRRQAEDAGRRQRRQTARAAAAPYRSVPLVRAQSGVRHLWVLVVMVAVLATYIWADATFGDQVIAHEAVVTAASGTSGRADLYRDAAGSTGLAALLIVVLAAAHVVTRGILGQGAGRRVVRLYAGAAAVVDLVLAFTLVRAATLAAVVLATGAEGLDPGTPAPFPGDEPWPVMAALLPFGVVGAILVVRSCWRLGRAVFGRPVAAPLMALPR